MATGDRPRGAIRTGDRVIVETGGKQVEVIIRSVNTKGQPNKLTGSFGFSVPRDEDDGPDEGQQKLPMEE